MTAVAPVLLKNMQEICEAVGKSRKTILKWRKEGAPFIFDRGVRKLPLKRHKSKIEFSGITQSGDIYEEITIY